MLDAKRLLEAITEVHRRFLAARGPDELAQVVAQGLRATLQISGADVGFIVGVSPGREGPVLVPECVLAVQPGLHEPIVTWLQDALDPGVEGQQLPRPLQRLAEVREPVISGYEPRLPILDNFLSLPLVHDAGGDPVVVMVLSNRRGGFDVGLLDALRPLSGACAVVLRSIRGGRARTGRDLESAQSARQLRLFGEVAPCVAYIVDADRQMLWASGGFADEFRVEKGAVLGESEETLIPHSLVLRMGVIDDLVRGGEPVVQFLEPSLDADGEVRWWQGARFRVEAGAGDAELVVGCYAVDVSENLRTIETLRGQQEALSEAQEIARLGCWTWRVEEDLISWDSRFATMCGVPDRPGQRSEALFECLHPLDVDSTRRALNQLVSGHTGRVSFEHRLLVAGEVRHLLVIAQLRSDEQGVRVSAVSQDVSERQRKERGRRELEAKASKFDSLSVLTGGMVHEFKQLLFSILGNAGIALDELEEDGLAAACVQDIQTASERGAALARQMSAVSARGRYVREAVELGGLVTGLLDAIRAVTSDRVRVRLDLHPELPPVDGAVEELRQLVLNLVVNASEAIGDEDGELALSTGVDEFGQAGLAGLAEGASLAPGRYVWLEVADTGGGMDAATQRRIFEPFFSTKAAGRGLGLAAVLGVARSHQGGVIVNSVPGGGARFRVVLPLGRARGGRTGRSGESWSADSA